MSLRTKGKLVFRCSKSSRSTTNDWKASKRIAQCDPHKFFVRPFSSSTYLCDDGRRGTTSSSGASGPLPTTIPSTAPTNELLHIIQQTIKANGPLIVPSFTRLALQHPTLGYYTRHSGKDRESGQGVLGKQGDFVTSPEISQVFGELLGIFFISQWQAQGRPPKTRLIELGPGRGTLMSDLIRTFRSHAPFFSTIQRIQLVESSPFMRRLQSENIGPDAEKERWSLDWRDRLEEVEDSPEEFTIIVAHEFFDALPVHIFEKTQKGFREVLVDVQGQPTINADKPSSSSLDRLLVNTTPSSSKPTLRLVLSPQPTPSSQLYTQSNKFNADRFSKVGSSMRVEVCTEAYTVSETMAKLIGGPNGEVERRTASGDEAKAEDRWDERTKSWPKPAGSEPRRKDGVEERAEKRAGGVGLIVDYGDEHVFGNSFRGFRSHQIVDPLSEPGQTDLTANVDFAWLREAMKPYVYATPLQTQRSFLLSLGLAIRLQSLLDHAPSADRKRVIAESARRLVDKTHRMGMGRMYKFMSVVPRSEKEEGQSVFPFDIGEVD